MLYKVHSKKIALITMVAMLANSSTGTLKVFANELNKENVTNYKNENSDLNNSNELTHLKNLNENHKDFMNEEGIQLENDALVNNDISLLTETSNSKIANITKFELQNNENFEEYNKKFKLDNSKIKSISNNGGMYPHSNIEKAIDGDLKTHLETGKPNSNDFTN